MTTISIGSIVILGCLMCSKYTSAAVPASRTITINQPLHSTDTIRNNSVCLTDDLVYNNLEVVPGAGPCEQCICNAPDIVCSVMKCKSKNGCKIIQKQNRCCPDYKCDCDYNGRSYNNGEKIDTSDTPCRVCYCKGGDVMCTTVGCYERDDCVGKIVPGTCCPKYDHCPPLDISSLKSTTIDAITSRTGKRGLQPWLLTTDVDSTINPVHELTTLDDNTELDVGIAQSPTFNGATTETNNSTIISAFTAGNDAINSSKAPNEVEKLETVAMTHVPVRPFNTTIDAKKEATSTVRTTTTPTVNEVDPFTESIILPYRRDTINDSHSADTIKCTRISSTTKDDIITVAFTNAEGIPKSDKPLIQSGNETGSNTFADVEKSTIDIVQQLLDVKTTIEGLATDIPRTTKMSQYGEGAVETKIDSATESVNEVDASKIENNLTVSATVVLIEDDQNYTDTVDEDTVIANVTQLRKNSSAAENGTTTAAAHVNLKNATSVDSTGANSSGFATPLPKNTNKTVSVGYLNTVSATTAESNSTNLTTAFGDSLETKNATAESPSSPMLEQSSSQHTSYTNDAELSTLSYENTEEAKVVVVAKDTNRSDSWEEIGKIHARVTVTENKNDDNGTDSSSVSAEYTENYANATAIKCSDCESHSSESNGNETNQIFENKTTEESIQGKQSPVENTEGAKLHEEPYRLNNCERNVTRTEELSSSSEAVHAVRTNFIVETTPKFDVITNLFEYATTQVARDNRTNTNASKSAASAPEYYEMGSKTFSEIGHTTRSYADKTTLNVTRITTQDILPSSSARNTSKDTTLASSSNGNESNSSFAEHAIDETNPVNLSFVPNTAHIVPEKYAIFYKADESLISGQIQSEISPGTTESTVAARTENQPILSNSTTETAQPKSKNDTNVEIPVTRPVIISNDTKISQPNATLLETNIPRTTLPADLQSSSTFANGTTSSTVSTVKINDTSTVYPEIAVERVQNITKYDFATILENETNSTNTTAESPNESNLTEIYSQKFVAHPVKLINTVNSVYMSPGLGFFENSLGNKTQASSNLENSTGENITSSTPYPQYSATSKHEENCTTENIASGTPYPQYGATSKHEDRKSNDSPWRNISLTNYKILLDSLIDGKVKPITRVPNVTIIPLSWLKGSGVSAVTEKSGMVTVGSAVTVSGRSNEQPNITETTVANDANSESLKNESRQEPAQAKVYDPLMPYPEEYPEEYQTIQNGPSLIITRTTYTRIPDVTYTTVTMVTLPTYQQVQKAEDGFADTLFDRKFHERSYPNDGTKDVSTELPSQRTGNSYFNIDVTKVEENGESDVLISGGKSLKKENQKSTSPRKGTGSKNEDSSMPMLDEKDMKIVQNFMNKNLRLH